MQRARWLRMFVALLGALSLGVLVGPPPVAASTVVASHPLRGAAPSDARSPKKRGRRKKKPGSHQRVRRSWVGTWHITIAVRASSSLPSQTGRLSGNGTATLHVHPRGNVTGSATIQWVGIYTHTGCADTTLQGTTHHQVGAGSWLWNRKTGEVKWGLNLYPNGFPNEYSTTCPGFDPPTASFTPFPDVFNNSAIDMQCLLHLGESRSQICHFFQSGLNYGATTTVTVISGP